MTKTFRRAYDGYVIGKLLDNMGLGLASLLGKKKKQRESPVIQERRRFEQDVKEQFIKLKEKGLSIPIFTL